MVFVDKTSYRGEGHGSMLQTEPYQGQGHGSMMQTEPLSHRSFLTGTGCQKTRGDSCAMITKYLCYYEL